MKFESAASAANRLNCTVRAIQKWAKEGKIPCAYKDGRDWKPTDVFTFELYEVSDDSFVIPDSAVPVTTQNKADKTFEFNLSYEDGDEGIYYYVVAEKNNGVANITYDTATYGVEVKVEKNQNLDFEVTEVKYTKIGQSGKVDEITFSNTYTPPTEPQKEPTSPKTGDNTNVLLWIALLFTTGGITAGCKKRINK